MLRIKNRTPFAATIIPFQDKLGVDAAAVVVKGTFAIRSSGGGPAIADEQLPIARSDTYYGEPGRSSVRSEADTCPRKPGTDVVLLGHAYGGVSSAESVDVELRAGPIRKLVRVFGNRLYYSSGTGFRISDAAPVERIPLVYERAFGGEDTSNPDPAHHDWEPYNPVGVGLCAAQSQKDLDGQRLPNLESPAALIRGPRDRPTPAGFGFIARSWLPRRLYAGTYDDRWKLERCPLLPEDFDDRFHHGAPPDQVTPQPLSGGERIWASGVLPGGGALDVTLPSRRIGVTASIKGRSVDCPPSLDTIVLEPDERRVVLSWRAVIPCGRNLLYIESVEITDSAA
jgi:hypothetical protein